MSFDVTAYNREYMRKWRSNPANRERENELRRARRANPEYRAKENAQRQVQRQSSKTSGKK